MDNNKIYFPDSKLMFSKDGISFEEVGYVKDLNTNVSISNGEEETVISVPACAKEISLTLSAKPPYKKIFNYRKKGNRYLRYYKNIQQSLFECLFGDLINGTDKRKYKGMNVSLKKLSK